MIDPEYLPEDLTQYLLGYHGNEEEYNSCDDGENVPEVFGMNSSEDVEIFIPPYARGNTTLTTDQESLKDSGMSEDEDDGDLSQPQNNSKEHMIQPILKGPISEKPNEPGKNKSEKGSNKRALSYDNANENSTLAKKKKNNKQDTHSSDLIGCQTKSNENSCWIDVFSSEGEPDNTPQVNAEESTSEFQGISTVGSSCWTIKDSFSKPLTCSIDCQATEVEPVDNSIPVEVDMTSVRNDDNDADSLPHQSENAEGIEDLIEDSNNSSVSLQTKDKNSTTTVPEIRRSNRRQRLKTRKDAEIQSITKDEKKTNYVVNKSGYSTGGEAVISIDCTSSEDTEDNNPISPKKKITPTPRKTKNVQYISPDLFGTKKELVICLQQMKNKNVLKRFQNGSNNSSLSKDCSSNQVEKTHTDDIQETHTDDTSSKDDQDNSNKKSPQKRKNSHKKSSPESDGNAKSSAVVTSPKTPACNKRKVHVSKGCIYMKTYRAGKRELLTKLLELKRENESLKRNRKGVDSHSTCNNQSKTRGKNVKEMNLLIQELRNKIRSLQKENKNLVTTEYMESVTKDLKNETIELENQNAVLEIYKEEINLYVEDLKNEVQQLHKEKDNLITVEDMESIVNDLKTEIEKLKKEKGELQINARETDSVVCDLKDELVQLRKEEGNSVTHKTKGSTVNNLKDEVRQLKKKKADLVSKAKEMKLLFQNLKRNMTEVTAEKSSLKSSSTAMESLLKNLEDEMKELKGKKEKLESNSKEQDLIIKDLKDEVGELKIEKADLEINSSRMDSLLNDLKEENCDLKKKKSDWEINSKTMDSIMNDLKSKVDGLNKHKTEIELHISELKDKIFQLTNKIEKNGLHPLDIQELNTKTGQLINEKQDLMKSVHNLTEELEQLKTDKDNSTRNTKEMTAVIQGLKEDLEQLKSKEKDSLENLKENQLRKEKGGCVTTEDMTVFVKDLKNEIGFLKGLIINQGELASLIKHFGNFQGIETNQSSEASSSGKQKLGDVSDYNDGHCDKRQKSGNLVSKVKPAGVCLHVNSGKVSVEFCSQCSNNSSS